MSDSHIIASAHLPNLRDVGGWPTTGGATIRPSVLYRSAALDDPEVLSDPGLAALELTTIVDMRTSLEADARPDHVPDGSMYRHVDILADAPSSGATVPAAIAAGSINPDAFPASFDTSAFMRDTYRHFVDDPTARAGFARVARTVLEADGRPVLIHCTAGKDRTGWAVAILMSAARATDEAVRTEYLSVSPAVLALFAPQFNAAARAGINPERLRPLLDVDASYIQAAFDRIAATFGSVEGYLRDGLALDAGELTGLRKILVKI